MASEWMMTYLETSTDNLISFAKNVLQYFHVIGQNMVKILHRIVEFVKWSILLFERAFVGAWLLLLYAAASWLVLATVVSFHFQAETSNGASVEEVLNTVSIQNRRAYLERRFQDTQWDLEDIAYNIDSLTRERDNISSDDQDRIRGISEKLSEEIQNRNKTRAELNNLKIAVDKIKAHVIFSIDTNSKKLRELASDFRYMREWGFEQVVLMPSQLLILILAISMGAFGSVIHLTWEYFDKTTRRRLSWYIFRPFLGAVLAFAIFILLKSGQMVLTNTTGVGAGAEDLNPYFISFLAIISGILSEQAYAKISAAGTQIFSPPEKARWIRKSTAETAMSIRNLNFEELGVFLNSPRKKTLEDWFDGETPLSERQQEIVSAWLGVTSRDLFTDQGPPSEGPSPETKVIPGRVEKSEGSAQQQDQETAPKELGNSGERAETQAPGEQNGQEPASQEPENLEVHGEPEEPNKALT